MNQGDVIYISDMSNGNDTISYAFAYNDTSTIYFYSIGTGNLYLYVYSYGLFQGCSLYLDKYVSGSWSLQTRIDVSGFTGAKSTNYTLGVGYYRVRRTYSGSSTSSDFTAHRSDGVSYRRSGYNMRVINSDFSGFMTASDNVSITAALVNAGRVATE